MVGLNGLEPSTSRLSGGRSNLLSYKPIQMSDGRCQTLLSFGCYLPDIYLASSTLYVGLGAEPLFALCLFALPIGRVS